MPTESVLMMVLKVILPTILGAGLGAGITLYGIRQNNKHNAAENAANRKHQLEMETAKAEIAAKYRSQDRRWAFRKDVYVNLLKASTDLIGTISIMAGTHPVNKISDAEWPGLILDFRRAARDFTVYNRLASLATEEIDRLVNELNVGPWPHRFSAKFRSRMEAKIPVLQDFVQQLQAAGRRDLWGTPEPEAKAEAAKQT
jgi:hypothetical protein